MALFADGRKQNWKYQNGVSMLYGDPNKAYLSFSHIPIKWQPLTLLPCSNFFFVFVSYFSTTLTVVSAEFFQCWNFFFNENAYINRTWNEFLKYFVLFLKDFFLDIVPFHDNWDREIIIYIIKILIMKPNLSSSC